MALTTTKCAIVVITIFGLFLTHGGIGSGVVDARRNQGSNQRKTSSSSSNSGHVTQASYNTHNTGASNSHADVAKLSYPNYNSQPNRPATNANPNPNPPAAGWNVHQQHGPPPANSASNPAGGAHTNMHEPPPAYHAPNYGAPHQPITATQNHGQQYAGGPPGASYYPSGSHMPGGGYPQQGGIPAGATYYPSAGHMPSGGYHPAAAPPGATYYQAGSALPPGATYYAQPPQQSSSGLGFGTGLLAGGLGGALLGHALTPSGGSSQPMAAAPAAGAAGGQDRIIIINNGAPVNASDGTTVINANGAIAPAHDPAAASAPMPMHGTQTAVDAPPAQLAPFSPLAANGTDPAAPPPPPPGGIICVPTKVNETDPTDSTKMLEVEKIACYPAPQPQAAAPGAEPVPLVPMATSQPPMLAPDQAAVRSASSGSISHLPNTLSLMVGIFGLTMLRFVAAAN